MAVTGLFTWLYVFSSHIPVIQYSSPSIFQPSNLRPPLIKRPLDFVPKSNFCVKCPLFFKTTCNIRQHFLGPMGGLKIEGPLYFHVDGDG